MTRRPRLSVYVLVAVALFAPGAFNGCAVHGSYRAYDPAYEDYHVWNSGEEGYYTRWEVETHRDHRDFRKRNADEQKEYWTWRHKSS
jgi:hypothetical protein